ncbi:MAG: hypothetical protein ACAH80_07255 [Alphaproteobacteria bacterium]
MDVILVNKLKAIFDQTSKIVIPESIITALRQNEKEMNEIFGIKASFQAEEFLRTRDMRHALSSFIVRRVSSEHEKETARDLVEGLTLTCSMYRRHLRDIFPTLEDTEINAVKTEMESAGFIFQQHYIKDVMP